MNYSINCKNAPRKAFLEALMPSILAQLGLTNSDKYLYITVESDSADAGMAVEVFGDYGIAMKTGMTVTELAVTLCHEMVHVRQMVVGLLKNGNTWRGKVYPADTDYLILPWEVQAFSRQEIIFRRAFASL